jgi:hypothetical protein
MFNENGEERYTVLTKNVLSNKAREMDSQFSDFSPDSLLNVENLEKAMITRDSLVNFLPLFEKEVAKLNNELEDEDFDSNNLSNSFKDLEQLIDTHSEFFTDAENDFDVDFGYLDIDTITDINFLSEALQEDKDEVIDNIKTFLENFNEKIEECDKFHQFTKDAIITLGIEIDADEVIDELVDGNDFSDVYEAWADDQYDYLMPMYNTIYPLNRTPSDNKCVQVSKETNLVVIEVDDEPYLALRGCGMDYSQYIGYAKGVVCGEPLDFEDCININTQEGLNLSGEKFTALMDKVEWSLRSISDRALNQLKYIEPFTSKQSEPDALDSLVKDFDKVNKTDNSVDSAESNKKIRRDR